MSEHDQRKFDFASVFPSKGDSRRPPDWWSRALLYTAIAVFVALFVWRSWGSVKTVVLDVIIAMFISLAMEPLVLRMVRHGWKRGVAAAICLIGLIVIVIVLLGMFGKMFVDQLVSMVKGLPALYGQFAGLVAQYTDFRLPKINNLGMQILHGMQTSWVTDFAGQALSTTMGFLSFLLNLLTIVMVTYYISAAGPKMRRSLCQWLAPSAQRRFILVWTVVQDQISGFLFSRTILAAINAFCTSIFLMAIHVPNWLPLAIFCGLTAQFIPTIGTYIGGALPVIFAWGSRGLGYAVAVVIFIVIYQQIENLWLSPKISQRTMDLNPAVAFLSVLVLGGLFGALGAFLALPVTASFQAIFKVYTKRYELVASPLMSDPVPVAKSKVVEGAEAFNEHVIRPVADHMPRAAKGSSANVPMSDEVRALQEEVYHLSEQDNGDGDAGRPFDNGKGGKTRANADESLTVAIPKGMLRHGGDGRGSDTMPGDAADAQGSQGHGDTTINKSNLHQGHRDSDGNPRSRWR